MTTDGRTDGQSFLSVLSEHWVKRSFAKPASVPNERLVSITREHWIKYVFPTVLYVLFTIASIALFVVSASVAPVAAGLGLVLLLVATALLACVQHWFFWFLLAESQACIIVTSRRVVYVHEGLLWNEKMIEVAFEKMKTVEAHKTTLLQSVLNYGTLQFEPMVKIRRVPHPGTIARNIEQAMGMI